MTEFSALPLITRPRSSLDMSVLREFSVSLTRPHTFPFTQSRFLSCGDYYKAFFLLLFVKYPLFLFRALLRIPVHALTDLIFEARLVARDH